MFLGLPKFYHYQFNVLGYLNLTIISLDVLGLPKFGSVRSGVEILDTCMYIDSLGVISANSMQQILDYPATCIFNFNFLPASVIAVL